MSEVIKITASSQLKSANAEKDIEFHSGKKNRGRFKHANENIDKSRTHLNAEFNVFDRSDLLEKHYGEKITKHNKNNNSEARHWDMNKFLATFEGKKVKMQGKETKNERWSTASQISYFGGTDSLNPVLEKIRDAGASQEEIVQAYTYGYGKYIEAHNEHFPTLPIYHSDVHFDESTPHGHDAIVVMGHTNKGNPTDSINNALGELYGYPEDFDGKRENMERYRWENDNLIFDAIAPELEGLAKQYGIDIEFEIFRTGAEGGKDMPHYLQLKEQQEKDVVVQARLDSFYDMEVKLQNKSKKIEKVEVEIAERTVLLDNRGLDLDRQRMIQIAREKELREQEEKLLEKEREIAEREALIGSREQNVVKHNRTATAVALAVLNNDSIRVSSFENIKKFGVQHFSPSSIEKVLLESINDANSGIIRRKMSGSIFIEREIKRMEEEQDGPSL